MAERCASGSKRAGRRVRRLVASAALVALLAGCGGGGVSSSTIKAALQRAVDVLQKYDTYMQTYNYKSLPPEMEKQLAFWMNEAMNAAPPVYSKPIVTRVNKDASIDAFSDNNANGHVDAGEPRLFRIEIDAVNGRVLATAEGGSTYGHHPRSSGFLAGVFIGSMMNRQRQAGIGPNYFTRRSVIQAGFSPASSTTRPSRRNSSSARGRARSGGIARGK